MSGDLTRRLSDKAGKERAEPREPPGEPPRLVTCHAAAADRVRYRLAATRERSLHPSDPALEQLLTYVSVDEKSHFGFFRDCLRIYMKHDRDAVILQLRRVMNEFSMPVVHDLLDDSARRIAEILRLSQSTGTNGSGGHSKRSSADWSAGP